MSVKIKKSRKPKTFHFDSWFLNQLRGICRKYPPYYIVRNRNKEEYFVTTKLGKQSRRVRNKCEICFKYMSNDDVRVDHIDPVVPLQGKPMTSEGKIDWNILIPRMLCPTENLQKICIECHNSKTQTENEQRKLLQKDTK